MSINAPKHRKEWPVAVIIEAHRTLPQAILLFFLMQSMSACADLPSEMFGMRCLTFKRYCFSLNQQSVPTVPLRNIYSLFNNAKQIFGYCGRTVYFYGSSQGMCRKIFDLLLYRERENENGFHYPRPL